MSELLRNLLFVAVGGAAGAIARFGLGLWLAGAHPLHFPLATLAINVSGSFLIGVVYVAIAESALLHADWRSILMVGFLGSYTTLSTFSLDTVMLFEHGHSLQALGNMALSVVSCVAAAWLGLVMARLLFSA